GLACLGILFVNLEICITRGPLVLLVAYGGRKETEGAGTEDTRAETEGVGDYEFSFVGKD
ncbi:hypothetical protein OFB79_25870, partial [Escherichia coli]|nr:hypothetical protein [Escherichia coli]